MSKYEGYKVEDNIRRKQNNTADELGWGPNNNVKSYSSKPGQLSAKSESQRLIDKQRRLNKKQPVTQLSKITCPIEREAFLNKMLKIG